MFDKNDYYGAENTEPDVSESPSATLGSISNDISEKLVEPPISNEVEMEIDEPEATPESRNPEDKFNLIAADGTIFPVSEKIVRQSVVFNEMLGHTSSSSSSTEIMDIPIKNVPSEIVEKVIEFCRHYENEAEPYIPPTGHQAYLQCPPQNDWSIIFLQKLDTEKLRQIMIAANYLDIPRLLDSSCYFLSFPIRTKTVEEIRKFFMIQNDYTKEEEQRMASQYLWHNDDRFQ